MRLLTSYLIPFDRCAKLYADNKLLVTVVMAGLLQFTLFKILYPFPDFFSDSYSYVEAARQRLGANIWPVGYSWFLVLMQPLSHNSLILVFIQYALVIASGFYLYRVMGKIFKPGRFTRKALELFLFYNPLWLYLSNYVSSDALFFAGSMLWFGQLLMIIKGAGKSIIWWHALTVTSLFTLRYNALVYPVVSALAFLMVQRGFRYALRGIGICVLGCLMFAGFTVWQNERLTGVRQFSIFSGWQLANNALYMYPYIHPDKENLPFECRQLDWLTREYFTKLPQQDKHTSPVQGAVFIKNHFGPLKQYLELRRKRLPDAMQGAVGWGSVAPVFKLYGEYLVKSAPLAYAQFYLLPNAGNYFIPPLEKLSVYNMGEGILGAPAVEWFGWKSDRVYSVLPFSFQGYLLFLMPYAFLAVNVLFAIGLLFWVINRGWQTEDRRVLKGLLLIGALLLVNFGFSVLASPIVFRYQVFPMLLLLFLGVYLMEKDMHTATDTLK